mgnify:CR=1 FL=1
MSSLLEQAIIDATALKEAALKNAEAAVLEKYAPEVKKAVEALLEQPEDPMAAPPMPADPMAAAGPEMSADDIDAPLAATEGEEMCGCPDEEDSEEMVIDFDELSSYVKGEKPEDDQQALAAELPPLQEQENVDVPDSLIDAILSELAAEREGDEAHLGAPAEEEELEEGEKKPDEDGDGVPDWADKKPGKDDKESLDEDALTDIVEKMVVDMATRKTGWLGVSEDTAKHEIELELARQQSTEFKEENEALKKATAELQEKLARYESTLSELHNKLDETNLTNARLFYANRVLKSGSLNERQKDKVVNAISKAGSVKEAKVIYETLQDTVGSTPDRRGPQSLREAVTRPSSIMSLRENRERREKADPVSERMQILAGIKR